MAMNTFSSRVVIKDHIKKDAGGTRQAAPFVTKTYQLVQDPATNDIVSWRGDDSFVVKDPGKFAAKILPCYFKHDNLSSFVRQLNSYGFRKTSSGCWAFSHPKFQRGCTEKLNEITRRLQQHPVMTGSLEYRPGVQLVSASGGQLPGVEQLPQDNTVLLTETIALRDQHEASQRLLSVALNDLYTTRQKLQQSEETIRRLLMFITNVLPDEASQRRRLYENAGNPPLVRDNHPLVGDVASAPLQPALDGLASLPGRLPTVGVAASAPLTSFRPAMGAPSVPIMGDKLGAAMQLTGEQDFSMELLRRSQQNQAAGSDLNGGSRKRAREEGDPSDSVYSSCLLRRVPAVSAVPIIGNKLPNMSDIAATQLTGEQRFSIDEVLRRSQQSQAVGSGQDWEFNKSACEELESNRQLVIGS